MSTAAPLPDWLQAIAALPHENTAMAGFLSLHPELRSPQIVELLHDEVLRSVYSDLNRAARLAHAAAELASELGDAGSRAVGLRALAHVSYAGSHYEDAVGYYREALGILESLGREKETGRTLLSGLQSLSYLGRYDEASAWAGRAREIFERLGDRLRLARLETNIGNILYRQDRYAEALAKYEEARVTFDYLGEHRDVAAVLSNTAVCQISLGRFDEALESYRGAREYCEAHDLPLLVALADYNIAYLHYLRGDFLRAIELYKASRKHCRDAGDHYHAALCDLDEAEIYLELNLNREAAHIAAEAEAGFELLGVSYEEGKAMVTHAVAASRIGERTIARGLFGRARRLFLAEQNLLWPALIDLYRAMLLERENSDRHAGVLCRRAYRVLSSSELSGRAALAELLQCRLLLKANQVARARAMSARALSRLETAGTPWLRFHAQLAQGQVEEAAGDADAAFARYQAARSEIEAVRSRLWADEPKISFLKDKLVVYENLVKAHLGARGASGYSPEEAFRCIQEAKSRSLAELISLPVSTRGERAPAAGENEMEEMRRDLDTQYRHIEHMALSARTAAARTQLETLREAVRGNEDRLLRLSSSLRSTLDGAAGRDGESLTLDAIQATIPSGAMLLEYYAVKGVLHVCLLDGSALEIVPLCDADEVRTRMRLLRFQIRKFRFEREKVGAAGESNQSVADAHLSDLYSSLVGPIRRRLQNCSHVIVAPHHDLHHLPFHALHGPEGYLIDEVTVSYAPSATVFALCSRRPARCGTESLVFGLPDRMAPNILLEAEAAALALPGARLFVGASASETVLRQFGPTSRFIHIATHGLFRRDNPLFSAIRLGDSHLTLLDLYRLPLTAELVTLSGCSTGLNVVVGGDELLGLVRGVLLAGARGVMVSLWDVNDVSTAHFMKHFYEFLQHAENKADALRSAMCELRHDRPHPFYWAPFMVAGKFDSNTARNGVEKK